MIWIHINGNVAEYTETQRGSTGQYYDLTKRVYGNDVWFSNQEYREDGVKFPNWYDSKLEALQAAMDYHETEGCELYLELYPAPEKGDWDWIAQDMGGDWDWIAQDMGGEWYGFHDKPMPENTVWDDGGSYNFIQKSPPNPFWRKTLR